MGLRVAEGSLVTFVLRWPWGRGFPWRSMVMVGGGGGGDEGVIV